MSASTLIRVIKKVVDTARKWVRARVRYRKLLDSKSATDKQLEKAKKKLLETTNQLEVSVMEFEAFSRNLENQARTPKKAFPWAEMLGLVSVGTGAFAKAMQPGQKTIGDPQVIDVESEVIK